jgi:membrane dipeptidase
MTRIAPNVAAASPLAGDLEVMREAVTALLMRHLVWDNHGCMPIRPNDESFLPQLERYRTAGVNVVTLNVVWDGVPADVGVLMLATLRRWVRERPAQYCLIHMPDDLIQAKTSGRLGVLFDIEGGCALRGHLPLVQLYYDLGVRWMLLAYNRANELASGCLDEEDGGLTEFGRRVVDEMCRVGMVACCSHTGPRSAIEIMERSTLPVIYSHSNASAIWAHPRNVGVDALRACARTGGVVGLNGYGAFIGSGGPTIPAALDHVCYIADLIGPEHVGLGLDYVFDPAELTELLISRSSYFRAGAGYGDEAGGLAPECVPELVGGLLQRGWSDNDVGGFLGDNLARVARAAWKAPSWGQP